MPFAPISRWFFARTIGQRLTLWGTAVTLGVCVLVCSALYVGVYMALYREVDGFLQGEVHELQGVVNLMPLDVNAATAAIRAHMGERERNDLTFRLLDGDGVVLLSSSRNDLLPKRQTPEIAAGPHFATLHVPGLRYPVRVCSLAVQAPDGRMYLTQTAYRLDRVGSSLEMVRVVCLGALTAAAALALVGGRILARRSLDPLHRILATAREIDAQRLSARLPRSNNGDELDQLAATLNDLLGRVERYVRHMEQFTADAAHELRTPLAALRGLTEVALRRPRSADELRQTIEEFGEHAERLARLAEDLLFLARIDAGEPVFRHEPVRLDQAAADAVELMEPLAAERGLELVIHAHAEAVVNGDGGRLRQLVGNLIDNAVKFSGAPGRVSVSVEQVNGDARVLVADTGSGIPADHLPRIFDRFYRIDQARSAQQDGGAGLGLSICKSIVEAHGGTIELRNAPGKGTVAEVVLPLSRSPTGAAD